MACGAALTGLVNSFVRVTQGVALGYPLAPRWGCEWWSRLRRWPTRLRQTDLGISLRDKIIQPGVTRDELRRLPITEAKSFEGIKIQKATQRRC